ncbi:RING finger and SPRY domain-containing protein 1 [Actinomortierella wolfii]|nr:RING finger and SPRY domain-containing protein 1 [Actinomortierella wolfii]
MNRIAGRLWVKVFVKAHIRAVWNKLNNMTDYDDPSSAFESLIRLTSSDSSYCDLLGVLVDTISPESPMASWFLYHIIDLAALPSQHTIRRLSQELLNKCSPGGLARLRMKKRCRPTAALVWGVLASRLAGELSSVLFSEEVCDCLLNNIEYDPDMMCKVFSIIALEKFALTGRCKVQIMQKPIQIVLKEVASMSTFGLTDQEEVAGIRQAKFCAEWALRRVFYDLPAVDRSGFSAQRDSISSSVSTSVSSEKSHASKYSHIKVMLNITEASRHWKISEDGLMVRNDGSSFESIRATVSVTCGKWYYEVTVLTSGIMQIGWATPHCRFCPDEGTGVGDDLYGFSYDGCRNLLWSNGESTHYGEACAWRPGDVLGFYLDVDNAQLECFINGTSLGTMTPFASIGHFQEQAAIGFFPAFSITPLQQIELNFGASPFSPMCRSRIFQRQMIPWPSESNEASGSNSSGSRVESGSTSETSGLCISGVSESFSAPVLNAQGDIVCSESSLQVPGDRLLTAADAAAHRLTQRRSTLATLNAPCTTSTSCSALSEHTNTAATCMQGPEYAASTSETFSPPSTAYFRFLTSVPGSRHRSTGVHPLAMDNRSTGGESSFSSTGTMVASPVTESVDPLAIFPSRGRSASISIGGPSFHEYDMQGRIDESLSQGPSLSPLPSSSASQVPFHALAIEEYPTDDGNEDGIVGRIGNMDLAEDTNHPDDASPRSFSSLDSFGSGREASLNEVMERVVPDFPDASALSSHRNSITANMSNLGVGPALVSGVGNLPGGHSNNSIASSGIPPNPLQDALPLPSPTQRAIPPLMPSQHALNALAPSSSSSSSASLSFLAGHHHHHHHLHQVENSEPVSSAISRRSSLADDMRLLLQQQGILPPQPPQSPMIDSTTIMHLQGGGSRARGAAHAAPSFDPSNPSSVASGGRVAEVTREVWAEQMSLGDSGTRSDSLSPLPTSVSFASSTLSGAAAGLNARPNGRRASLPANRLEM